MNYGKGANGRYPAITRSELYPATGQAAQPRTGTSTGVAAERQMSALADPRASSLGDAGERVRAFRGGPIRLLSKQPIHVPRAFLGGSFVLRPSFGVLHVVSDAS